MKAAYGVLQFYIEKVTLNDIIPDPKTDYDLEGKMEAKRNWNLMRMKLYFPDAFSNNLFGFTVKCLAL